VTGEGSSRDDYLVLVVVGATAGNCAH
jgi:hypothetical protein